MQVLERDRDRERLNSDIDREMKMPSGDQTEIVRVLELV